MSVLIFILVLEWNLTPLMMLKSSTHHLLRTKVGICTHTTKETIYKCKALLTISKPHKKCKWIIKTFNNVHNHDMLSPKSVNYLWCHQKMSVAAKSLVEKFDDEWVPTGMVAAMLNSGDMYFCNTDCWNHLRNLWRRNLDIGYAQAVFNFV